MYGANIGPLTWSIQTMGKVGKPPFEITPEVCEKAYKYASQGCTKKQIAESLGINYSTLNKKEHQFDEFAEAIKKGQAVGITEVTNKLYEKALNGDTTSILFYLKCRAGWREIAEDQTQKPPITVNIVKPDGID